MTESSHAYDHFRVAIYARAYEVAKMTDLDWLDKRFRVMERAMRPDKIYLETHRDLIVIPDDDLAKIKAYFADRSVETAGGITITIDEGNLFQTFCYTTEEHRRKLVEIVELTARNFDEFILDDFFFTSCTCESCVAAKGDRTWTEFRLGLMERASHELIIEPAKRVNPNVKAVVKFPNWYEHYQGCGLNLEAHRTSFDGIYTGTETRDPILSNQHLQEYLGYEVVRYLENAKPGGNGGGWVDPGGMRTLDRYAEQVWITMFAKAREITFFDFRQLQNTITESHRAPWQRPGNSVDFSAIYTQARDAADDESEVTIAYAAGAALRAADAAVANLGNPVGIASYKPYHSTGEDYLHTYLGMVGIPIELVPEYPEEAPAVLLAETATHDPQILAKLEHSLLAGATVVLTGGFVRRMQERGLRSIIDVEVTAQKAMIEGFVTGWGNRVDPESPMLVSHIRYNTNDSWEEVSAIGPYTGYPLLHYTTYAAGTVLVLNVPDNWSDLYRMPASVLTTIRDRVTRSLPFFLEGPARVSLFLYDNRTMIVESFCDEQVNVVLHGADGLASITDLASGERIAGRHEDEVIVWTRRTAPARTAFAVTIPPHSFRVFSW